MAKKSHTRKLRKSGSSSSPKRHQTLSIPELRNAFEYIEEFADKCGGDVKAFREEWKKVFYKELDKESAKAYLEHIKDQGKKTGGAALAGAPLDYTTRPGVYITAGINNGSYAQVPQYVASGFWNPEPARLLDPLPQQYRFPTHVTSDIGSNLVKGGGCGCNLAQIGGKSSKNGRKTRKLRKAGGGIIGALQTTLMRPFQMSSPMNVAQSLSEMAAGRSGGVSPQAADPSFKFQKA
jgi:hypothetical protein